MTSVAIDADALHCIRSFGLLDRAASHVETTTDPSPLLICTGFVARQELNLIARDLTEWEVTGLLRIQDVPSRSPASDYLGPLALRTKPAL